MEERFSRNSDKPQLLALGLGTHLLQPSALPQVDCMTDPIIRLNGAGSFTFPEGMTFAEADEAFVLGEPVQYEGLMHDPRKGWYRVRVPVIVSGASCVGEGWFIVTLKIAGEPEDLLAH